MSQDEDVNAAWTILPDPSRDQVSHLKMVYWKRKESSASGKEGSNLGFWVAVLAQVILNSFIAVI